MKTYEAWIVDEDEIGGMSWRGWACEECISSCPEMETEWVELGSFPFADSEQDAECGICSA